MTNSPVSRHYPSFRHTVAGEACASARPTRCGGRERKFLARLLLGVATILFASLSSAAPTTSAPLPGTVLVLNRSIPYTEYFGKVLASFQSTLKAGSDIPITIYSEQLEYNHFKGPEYENILRTFIKEKFRSTPIGVIVADGFDALQFALRLRPELDPAIPIVFSNIDDATAADLRFPSNVTGTTIQRPISYALVTGKALVPGLKRIAVVGDPLEEQTYRRHYKKELPVITEEVEFIDLTGLPMSELRKRVAALPEDAAIFYTTFSSSGAPSSANEGLALVAEAANRPIIIDQETRLGHGGTGGFLLQAAPIGEATARILLRLFNGESASTIPVVAGEFVKPVFDWRELKQWRIPEDNLPSGSEVRFREYDVWLQYRPWIITISAAVLLQAALISLLLYEIGRRHRAEFQSRSAMAELTHMNRRAAAGLLSASLTHEVNQPLAAMVAMAGAALRWLRAEKPNIERAEAALENIVAAGNRAGDIVTSVRAMFKKQAPQNVSADINLIVRSVLSIMRVELQKHGVVLQTQLNEQLPTVQGDKVQLQQVVLNLVMNGIEAMQSVSPRVLKVRTDQPKAGIVRVSIEDTGTGMDPANLDQIFKPLFTTKSTGMGVGLSICQSIIESHGGRIRAVPAVHRGLILQFELPIR
jgi:signal transduction histidine kinase